MPDSKFETFPLKGWPYITFINVGMWESVKAFENAITAAYIYPPEMINGEKYLHITKFEFKIRERVFLKEVSSRGIDLPSATNEE